MSISIGSNIECPGGVGGLEPFVFLYNIADWKAVEAEVGFTEGTNGEVTAIVNPDGIQAYKFQHLATGTPIVPTNPMRTRAGLPPGYDHSLTMQFELSPAQFQQLNQMRCDKVVAIVMGLNGYGYIYGREQGLGITSNDFDPSNIDTGGIVPATLATDPERPPENKMPTIIDAGDYASTLALITGLETPGTP